MNNRRHLVQRNRNPEPSPAQSSRGHRDSEAPARQTHALPPYQPPSCPLSADAQQKIADLRLRYNHDKYKRHIQGATGALGDTVADCHERVTNLEAEAKSRAAKFREKNGADTEMPSEVKEREGNNRALKKQVDRLTVDAEKALRELIDYGDELAMHDSILREVETNIAQAPAAAARRRRGEDENEGGAPAEDPEILSAVELLAKAKEDYTTTYGSRSMKSRYASHNDYKQFKSLIHDARYSKDGQCPPLPHSRTWFPEDNAAEGSARKRPRNNMADETVNGENDSDDDVVIEGEKQVLKCPLTLQFFRVPYSNDICPHTFERDAIINYINDQGVPYQPPTQRGQRRLPPTGPKRAKCPQTGCDKMLSVDDFSIDRRKERAVQRQIKGNSQQDDDDDNSKAPRGTQRNRPEHVEDQSSDVDIDDADEVEDARNRARDAARVKRERAQSRGLSMAPSSRAIDPDEDGMDVDEI